MSSRTLLSRPRTRVYDANYNIGERYYKPMLDHCDRKYAGRASDPPPPFPAVSPRPKEDDFTRRRTSSETKPPFAVSNVWMTNSVSGSGSSIREQASLKRHSLYPCYPKGSVTPQASNCPRPQRLMQSLDLAEDDMGMPRRRPLAESDAAFERAASVGRALANGRTANGCFDAATDDLMDEVTSSVRRLRASKARAIEDMEDDFESSVSRRKQMALMRHERGESLADKHLEAVGIRKIRDPEEDPFFRKRVLRITNVAEDSPDLTKWSKVRPVADMALEDGAAVARARKTRDRLADLESEIEDVAERTARRDRRAAELRSFMAENATSSQENASSVRVSLRSEKKTVTF